jgi:hypothetical protein
MGPRRSNALRKEEAYMETATSSPEHATHPDVTLPTNGRPSLFASAAHTSRVKLIMQRLFQYLSEGRNTGPLLVLVIVLIYSLLSPHLPAPIHDYIYHIAH